MRQPTRRNHFTKKLIESLKAPAEGRITVYDAQQQHLGLRIESSGRKSFFWLRKIRGRPTFKPIGVFPDTSIEQARDTVNEWNGSLAEWKRHGYEGGNPFESRRGDLTFAELVERYIAKQVKSESNNPEKAEQVVRWQVEKYLSHFRGRKLDEISGKEVQDLHDELGHDHGKVIADRVVQLVRRLYFWASLEAVGLFSGENPAVRVKFNGYQKRDRFLQPEELLRLFKALSEEPNRDLRDFVELALATGARRSNVLGMQWTELTEHSDAVWTWTITKTKTGKPYVLPLTPRAVQVLERRRYLQRSSPFVFPSPNSKSGHLEEPKKPWKRLLARAKLTDFVIHDLRRTNASYQAISGVNLQAIAKTLGHSSTASTEVYARLNTDVARAALLAGNKTMEEAMTTARNKQQKQLPEAPYE